jgi:hypothetical protein
MPLRHPELDALSGALSQLLRGGVPAEDPQVVLARDAIRLAGDAMAQAAMSSDALAGAEMALAAARNAVDRARQEAATARAGRQSWMEVLRAPVPSPADPGGEGEARGGLELNSEIPEDHPDKEAIETAVAGAFAGVRGKWHVSILVQEKASWWGVRVEGPSVAWTGTLEGPEEQSPEFLSGRVREAVQLGLMQSALEHDPRARD